MKKRSWRYLVWFMMACALSACSSNNGKAVVDQSKVAPCMVTLNNVPNNAMGKLGIQIFRVGDEVKVILPSDTVFDVNSGEIQKSAYPGLNYLANYLKSFDKVPMQVTGYTDDLGLPVENKWIAEQQARSLITYLWTRGLDHCVLTPVGVGEDEAQTVASNRSIGGSAANRRVEITFRAKPHPMML